MPGRRREPNMIAALVPAAGSSTRMGRPKLLLEIRRPELDRPGRRCALRGRSRRVVVVAPPADAAEGPPSPPRRLRRGPKSLSRTSRPAEMRDSIELGLELLARGQSPTACTADARRLSRDHRGVRRPDSPNTPPAIPDRMVIPCLQRPAGPSDRLTVAGRRPSPVASRRHGLERVGRAA